MNPPSSWRSQLLLSSLLVLTLQAGQVARPTIIAKVSDAPRRNFYVIYYDDSFLFAARNFGDSRDFGGNTDPGFFVHSKEKRAWIQITAISTADGKFGKSSSDDPDARQKLRVSPVMWDFTQFAESSYIEQPLRTSASIAFPNVEYESDRGRYRLRYFSSWGVATAETILYVDRADLIAAFGNRNVQPPSEVSPLTLGAMVAALTASEPVRQGTCGAAGAGIDDAVQRQVVYDLTQLAPTWSVRTALHSSTLTNRMLELTNDGVRVTVTVSYMASTDDAARGLRCGLLMVAMMRKDRTVSGIGDEAFVLSDSHLLFRVGRLLLHVMSSDQSLETEQRIATRIIASIQSASAPAPVPIVPSTGAQVRIQSPQTQQSSPVILLQYVGPSNESVCPVILALPSAGTEELRRLVAAAPLSENYDLVQRCRTSITPSEALAVTRDLDSIYAALRTRSPLLPIAMVATVLGRDGSLTKMQLPRDYAVRALAVVERNCSRSKYPRLHDIIVVTRQRLSQLSGSS